jgi:hypothetical protein
MWNDVPGFAATYHRRSGARKRRERRGRANRRWRVMPQFQAVAIFATAVQTRLQLLDLGEARP